jgi:prephenate dehydrogenase
VAEPDVVGIVGTGLIGGSIGMRARRNGAYVVGYDDDPTAVAGALAVGALDQVVTRDELYARADTVVIAAHLAGTIAEIARLRDGSRVRAGLVLDVASVKVPVCEAADDLANFVATHPMAGSERRGAAFSTPTLFDGRTWAYVPSDDPRLTWRTCRWLATLGGLPLAIEPREHDRIVAYGSHLPQILAWIYARRASERDGERSRRLAGAAARELLRLGAAEWEMWPDVLRENARNLVPELRGLGAALLEAADWLGAGELERIGAIRRQDRESTAATAPRTGSRSADISP